MSTLGRITRSGALAHAPSLVAPFVVVALAAALVSVTGVLVESGLRSDDGGMVVAVASSFAGTALVLVIFVVTATVQLALRQRHRDLALMRAVGATAAQMRALVAREVTLVTVTAAPLGALAGLYAAPLLTPSLVAAGVADPGLTLHFSPAPVVAAVLVLLPVTLLAARLATRATLRQAPTTAVAQSLVEPLDIGRTRKLSAAVVAGLGLVTAFSPVVVPGTLGAATSAVSAFLLIGAVALAGPALVAWVLERTGTAHGTPAVRLALANTRGFSRRLTTVVVPLALALGVGTVQASTDDALAKAAGAQLRAGLAADLVVTGADVGDQVAELSSLAGVDDVVALSRVPAKVRTDDESQWLGALGWEPVAMLALPPEGTRGMLDPSVVEGDLAALAEPGTIAISRDAQFDTGKGIGEEIAVDWGTGTPVGAKVVAIHERGLGFGDYLVAQDSAAAHGVDVRPDTLLLGTDDATAVRDHLAGPGFAGLDLVVQDEAGHVQQMTIAAEGATRLSSVLLLALLLFVGVAAANALVLSTAGRAGELLLLRRTGATRRQLLAMAGVESLVTGGVAWLVGTATVVPAAVGVTSGLLGWAAPAVAWTTYGWLSLTVLLIPLLTVVPVVARGLLAHRVPVLGAAGRLS
ncbi:FtsX-like permease family protein [Nocardioides jishulii]|uniref:FtsX-like permease family protein n=1 Tax=Nocardioides jishulii TaxID=2575440 RepID=A0A4U2YIG0_9ACTN|nr:FtsX-like permease family protein [Nocardioides jishulii]QCX28165.1 FtsX-like permease family protein [Nocardioides jishulii]TKI60829.1 FtsX-like permease family protein [Nocardioides jishulii]